MDSLPRWRAARDAAVYQYSTLTAPDQNALVANVLASGELGMIGGHYVHDLERQVAERLHRHGAVATSSATAGIELLLRSLPATPMQDRVVIPEVCWISVPTAVGRAGKTPVVAPVTSDLTPHWEQIEPLLNANTAAVILAHFRGRPAPDTHRIADELARRDIALIEDCAQAWAVTLQGHPVGTRGVAAVFSTQTHKLIATGEGGLVVADDPDLLDALRAVGGDTRRRLPEGADGRGNTRMSELTAATALPQLDHLDRLTKSLRALQLQLIDVIQRSPKAPQVLPQQRKALDPIGATSSNGSLVGMWLPNPRHARKLADELFQRGIRSWWPGPGDCHIAENWPLAQPACHGLVDLRCYLDIQVPALAEQHHVAYLELVYSALRAVGEGSEGR